MALRDRMAFSAAPIFLRIGIGVTFVWAGLGKFLSNTDVQGQDAAILANLGADIGGGSPPVPVKVDAPATKPSSTPAATDPSAPTPAPDEKPADKPTEKATEKAVKSLDGKKANRPPALMAFADPPQGGPQFTMADFPEPRPVRRVYQIALVVWKAGNPAPEATGTAKRSLVPEWAVSGRWPIRLAWACAVAETLGGTLILVGLFTRLSALAIAINMGVACWLTVIGPAIQDGNTKFGFLPNYPSWSDQWHNPLWQFALITSAIALFFAGPGAASLDSVIFSRDAEPQPRPKPAE